MSVLRGAAVNVRRQGKCWRNSEEETTMIRKYLLLFLSGLTLLNSSSALSSTPHLDSKVATLVNKLAWKTIPKGSGVIFEPPKESDLKQVPIELLEIAKKSPGGRVAVIKALIKTLEDPNSRGDGIFAYRWLTAAYLLGELKAVEGIDALIKNLDFRGQNGIVLSINIRPASDALIKIGRPSIPKLMAALSDSNPEIRSEASGTLSAIEEEEKRKQKVR